MRIDKVIAELNLYEITNQLEISHFLAQADHESMGFTKFSEGEKYRYTRAKAIWANRREIIEKKRLDNKALDFDFCPQPWLFNTVYGNRMGNIEDDDGYNFRGAGIFQLTGRSNYQAFVNWLDDSNYNIDNIRDYCLTDDGAIISAIWFWKSNNIGALALKDDGIGVTRKINGGTVGINERLENLYKYKILLGV
jgi:putative chitinase